MFGRCGVGDRGPDALRDDDFLYRLAAGGSITDRTEREEVVDVEIGVSEVAGLDGFRGDVGDDPISALDRPAMSTDRSSLLFVADRSIGRLGSPSSSAVLSVTPTLL